MATILITLRTHDILITNSITFSLDIVIYL